MLLKGNGIVAIFKNDLIYCKINNLFFRILFIYYLPSFKEENIHVIKSYVGIIAGDKSVSAAFTIKIQSIVHVVLSQYERDLIKRISRI